MRPAGTICPGQLTLQMVADDTGHTRTALAHQRYPQRMSAPLHCDARFPNAAVVCVQSPSGGTFSDDDLETTVDAGPRTHLRITTQAASQVFAGPGPGARHRLSFRIEAGGVLEYLPKTLIPHADSRYTQVLEVDVDATGFYLGWDAVAAGRLGHGERFRYRSYESAQRLSVEGRTVARDRQHLEPPSAQRLIGADYVATFLAVAPSGDSADLLRRVRRVLDDLPAGTLGGAGELPSSAGVLVRVTTDSAPDLQRTQTLLLNEVRDELLRGSRQREERTP